MPLPEAMLLIAGELITDISKELLRITSRPKIIPIKNPIRRGILLIKYHIQGPANPLNQKPVSSGELSKSSDTALRPSATNISFLPILAHKMLSLQSDCKQSTSFSRPPCVRESILSYGTRNLKTLLSPTQC